MRKIIKNNIKIICMFVITGILFRETGVIASAIIEANNIKYTNEATTTTNVQDAIDELFEKAEFISWEYVGDKTPPQSFPNKDDGYIISSVNCSGADGVWDNVSWSINFTNIEANIINCKAIVKDDIEEVYGTSIQTSYPNIYTNVNPATPISSSLDFDRYYAGNFAYPFQLNSTVTTSSQATNISSFPQSFQIDRTIVYSGTNTNNLTKSVISRWVNFYFYAGYSTSSVNISKFALVFKDGSSLTIQSAVDQGYVEPLVIVSSAGPSQGYVSSNFYNIIYGDKITGSYSFGLIFVKVTAKSELIGYTFNSDNDWNTTYDGITTFVYSEKTKISIEPLE